MNTKKTKIIKVLEILETNQTMPIIARILANLIMAGSLTYVFLAAFY